jgi:hypothetical protein
MKTFIHTAILLANPAIAHNTSLRRLQDFQPADDNSNQNNAEERCRRQRMR